MKTTLRLCGVAAALALCLGSARADVKPYGGDYEAAPAGTDLFLLYYQHHEGDEAYSKGKKVADDLGVRLDIGLLRYVHFADWNGYRIDPQIIVPFAHQRTSAADTTYGGLGDVIFGGTLWTLNDPERKEYLGWSVFITAPTGSHRDDGFAVSGDRWAADFQVGYVRRLAPKWTLDLIGEVEFYADRRYDDARRDPLLQGHAHLRYHWSDATQLALSYRHSWGARERADGTTLTSRRDNNNMTVGWDSWLARDWQLQLQYTRDLEVREGLKTQGVQARLLKVF